jgi:hypothetical protein
MAVTTKECLDRRKGLLNWVIIRRVRREINELADYVVVSALMFKFDTWMGDTYDVHLRPIDEFVHRDGCCSYP